MNAHPKKGLPVKITAGPLIGQYFVITDYVVNQFQGKDIKKIAERYTNIGFGAMEQRGYPIDEQVVFGRLYPSMQPMVVHDSELKVDMKVVQDEEGEDVELPINVTPIGTGKKVTKKKASKKIKAGQVVKENKDGTVEPVKGEDDDAGSTD
jgi:hypothetical protein